MSAPRAVLFDLDETLYPERRFALSGFSAIARLTAADAGVGPRVIFRILSGALRSGQRAAALQHACSELAWPESRIASLVGIIRSHAPNLRMPKASIATLRAMRPHWRIAIVTNGLPSIQVAKVAALGIRDSVDTIVYAAEHGTGAGKPEPEPFIVAAARLGVEPSRCVMVGDDPRCDIAGARRAGMKSIRIRRGVHADLAVPAMDEADAVTGDILDVPRLARILLGDSDESVPTGSEHTQKRQDTLCA